MSAEDSDEEDEDEYLLSNRKALVFDDEFTGDRAYQNRRTPDLMESVLDKADRVSRAASISEHSSDSEIISRTDELFAVMRFQQQHPRESSQLLLDDVFNPDVRVDLFTHPEPEQHPYSTQDSYILPTNSATQQFYACENPDHFPHLQYEHCCTKSVHPYQNHSFAPLPPKSQPQESTSSLPSSRRSNRSTAGRIVRGLTKSLRGALSKGPSNTGSGDGKGKKRMRSPDFETSADSSSASLLPPFRLKRSKKF
ncbi:uncharacterized protein EV420DRAFT_1560052 [Desarmillaria tabescens]|uniref:Uncharacterized protein n=1 Tax=Armillaria tabescens TaxID=1929756 RepID=A0AA39JYI0_ARMTA|nr:uncharacterized protein EV420DRAFT_1560052 [Desarmillaria tabescens]KAK0451282.1 hypothetical protein EV420DRAFT_1560052 [Desarmillaria tabescens]